MKSISSRAVIEVAALEARRLFCMSGDHAGFSTTPSMHGDDAPATTAAAAGTASGPEAVDQLIVPAYSSRPGAGRKFYMDFNGHAGIENWNGWWAFGGKNVTETPAYDIDGSSISWSNTELANILKIWKGVAEKFSPFDIDVTTIKPSSINGAKVIIGGDGAWYGSGGGVASIGGWGEEGFTDANAANIAFVWSNQADPFYVMEAVAHEAGHTLDLYHQSRQPIQDDEYTAGFIMGSGAANGLGRWASTSVDGTTSTSRDDDTVIDEGAQDDLARIDGDNGFTYRVDDAGSSTAASVVLPLTNVNGVIAGAAAGVIERTSDVDAYRISHSGGSLDLEVLAAEVGRMLDPRLTLADSSNIIIGESFNNSGGEQVGERIQFNNLNAGTYYIRVSSSGTYGSIGQYRINVRAGLASTATNDTLSTATLLGTFGNPDFIANGFFGGTAVIADSLTASDNFDFFKVRAPAHTRQVSALLNGQTVSCSLAMYDDVDGDGLVEVGEIVFASNPSTTQQSFSFNNAAGGKTYYVRVARLSSGGNGNYNLRITADTGPTSLSAGSTAPFDPQPLVGGKVIYDSIDAAFVDNTDYYRFTAKFSGLASLYLSNNGNGDVRLDTGADTNGNGVFDGVEILRSSASVGGGNSETIQEMPVFAGQQYLVRVMGQGSNQSSNYTLQAIADYATGGNLTGALAGAQDFTAVAAGSIYEHLDGAVDRFDTFRISPANGPMQAILRTVDFANNHKLEIIRDANNNSIVDAGEIVAEGFMNQQLNHTVSDGATYYMRVRSFFFGEFFSNGNYRLAYSNFGSVQGLTQPGPLNVSPNFVVRNGYLGFDPADDSLNNRVDVYGFTLTSRTRFDALLNRSDMGLQVLRVEDDDSMTRLAGVGRNQGVVNAINVNLDPGTYFVYAYLPVGERQDTPSGGNYTLSTRTGAIIDNAGPVASAPAFQYEIAPVGMSVSFDQETFDVDRTDSEIFNIETETTYNMGTAYYDAATRRAGYGVSTQTLPDGNYVGAHRAGTVRDAAGNPNAAPRTFTFFVLAGDANRDRAVNLDDFTALAANFGRPGSSFSQGDFNYDRAVNLDDFTLLASKFGNVLAAPPASRTTFGATQLSALPLNDTAKSEVEIFGNRRNTVFSEVLLDQINV